MLPYQLHQKLRAAQQQGTSSSSNLSVLRGLKFWIWDKEQHRQQASSTKGNCCIQHVLGLPIKNGKAFPLFDFQKQIFDSLENNQNIWIKKARGIGVTTFLIRYLVWKILYSNELDGKSIFIISGTREEFANYVKKKMEDLFLPRFRNVVFDSKYTELWINKTWIKVMPTKNIKDVRGYMDVAYLFIDEADHFNLLGLRLRENQCCIHMKKIFRSIVDAMTKTVSISPLGLVLYSPESISRQN